MVTVIKPNVEGALARYMALPYRIELIPDAEDGVFVVSMPDLPGCISQGDSIEEAMEMIRDAQRGWLTVALEHGDPIPDPRLPGGYSGRFNVRVPRSLHRTLVETADAEGVSLNLLVATALAHAVNQPVPAMPRPGRPRQTPSGTSTRS